MAARFTWRRKPKTSGSGYSEQPAFLLRYDRQDYGKVPRMTEGWCWVAGNVAKGVAMQNSLWLAVAYKTKEQAQEACMAYVRECLAAHMKETTAT
jgi:hypothetical protein